MEGAALVRAHLERREAVDRVADRGEVAAVARGEHDVRRHHRVRVHGRDGSRHSTSFDRPSNTFAYETGCLTGGIADRQDAISAVVASDTIGWNQAEVILHRLRAPQVDFEPCRAFHKCVEIIVRIRCRILVDHTNARPYAIPAVRKEPGVS